MLLGEKEENGGEERRMEGGGEIELYTTTVSVAIFFFQVLVYIL